MDMDQHSNDDNKILTGNQSNIGYFKLLIHYMVKVTERKPVTVEENLIQLDASMPTKPKHMNNIPDVSVDGNYYNYWAIRTCL